MPAYSCYILENPKRKTYVGITLDLKKRLRQHNGELKGGAKSTHKKGPWHCATLINGFRTKHEALSFEWYMCRRSLKRHSSYKTRSKLGGVLEKRKKRMRILLKDKRWKHLIVVAIPK